ncbi:MAG: hypothetical protein GYB64_14195 [Chloroflexi bacterium]|nr:hypothetical protein [Chloroflexota bacterium]
MCEQSDRVEAVGAIYARGSASLGWQMRPPSPPEPAVERPMLEPDFHPDRPTRPLENRSWLAFALRGLLPFFLVMTACIFAFRLSVQEAIMSALLVWVLLMFVVSPLLLVALIVVGSWAIRWMRLHLFGPTYSERLEAIAQMKRENERRRAENARQRADYERRLAAYQAVFDAWHALHYCHRDQVVFHAETGRTAPPEEFRRVFLHNA